MASRKKWKIKGTVSREDKTGDAEAAFPPESQVQGGPEVPPGGFCRRSDEKSFPR